MKWFDYVWYGKPLQVSRRRHPRYSGSRRGLVPTAEDREREKAQDRATHRSILGYDALPWWKRLFMRRR